MTDSSKPKSNDTSNLSVRDEINLIKKENLTGQQLRMARKLAQKHGIESTSDLDSVRLLRKQGIDPFANSGVIDSAKKSAPAVQIASGEPAKPAGLQQVQLPVAAQTMSIGAPAAAAPPSGISDADRLAEIRRIQADLMKRRRRRLFQVIAKLLIFVALPTAIAGYYFFAVATPMYSTYSDFVIQKAEGSSSAATGGLLSGTSFASTTDSIAVQSFLTSRDAMQKLDRDQNFRSIFENEKIDDLQRLETDASNEAAYKIFKKRIHVGYDPTEGVIKMEVIAPSPEASYEFSKALIGYAEQQVDQLTSRKRADTMKSANESYNEQERMFQEAQDRLLEIQEKNKTVSGELKVQQLTTEISTLRSDLITRRLVLAQLENNARPSKSKVAAQKASIRELEKAIGELNKELTDGAGDARSVARITAELGIAQRYVELRQTMLATSLNNKESAAIEANRQSRYLELAVSPVVPDQASYPKKFENTLLAFLVFLGIYLMLSLTASILREQVSN